MSFQEIFCAFLENQNEIKRNSSCFQIIVLTVTFSIYIRIPRYKQDKIPLQKVTWNACCPGFCE